MGAGRGRRGGQVGPSPGVLVCAAIGVDAPPRSADRPFGAGGPRQLRCGARTLRRKALSEALDEPGDGR